MSDEKNLYRAREFDDVKKGDVVVINPFFVMPESKRVELPFKPNGSIDRMSLENVAGKYGSEEFIVAEVDKFGAIKLKSGEWVIREQILVPGVDFVKESEEA